MQPPYISHPQPAAQSAAQPGVNGVPQPMQQAQSQPMQQAQSQPMQQAQSQPTQEGFFSRMMGVAQPAPTAQPSAPSAIQAGPVMQQPGAVAGTGGSVNAVQAQPQPGFFAKLVGSAIPGWGRSNVPPQPTSFDANNPAGTQAVHTATEIESAIEAQQPMQADLLQNKIEDEATLILSYTDSCKFVNDNPGAELVAKALTLNFEGRLVALGFPSPTLPRRMAMKASRVPREEYGLFVPIQATLGNHSLFKMEQRLVRTGILDRKGVKAMLSGQNQGESQGGILTICKTDHADPTPSNPNNLSLGNLPTVAEGYEFEIIDHRVSPQRGRTQSPLKGLGSSVAFQLARHHERWLDEAFLMVFMAEPLRVEKERPWRRYDQDQEAIATHRTLPVAEFNGSSEEIVRTFRLDIELGRLEFLVHPGMAHEDLLVARLLAAFREFKRRESIGLVPYYANRLAALEESLLVAREKLFHATDGSDGARGGSAEASLLVGKTAQIERDVIETRQLKEDEEVLMWRASNAMQILYSEISQVRDMQGYWATNVELTVLTRPPEEQQWSLGVGTSRERLDIELLMAEDEEVLGLPPPPYPLPSNAHNVGQGDPGVATSLFRPRRVETTCTAHQMTLERLERAMEVTRQQQQVAAGNSAFPAAGQQLSLLEMQAQRIQAHLDELGRAPRRVLRSPEQEFQAREKAQRRLATSDIGVLRVPILHPILTVNADPEGGHRGTHQRGRQLGSSAKPARYYARLLVNGEQLEASDDAPLGEDFIASFKDTFSVRVVKWPETIAMQFWEKGTLRDTFVSQVYVSIPGQGGQPHIDPHPKSYQFSSQTPMRARNIRGIPPGATQGGAHGFTALHGPGDDTAAAGTVYPSGTVFVRCGWVTEARPSGGVSLEALAELGGGGALRSSRVLKPLSQSLTDNPIAQRAHLGALRGNVDLEAGRLLMPPLPHVSVDRMLRRAAERIGTGKATRVQVMRWLAEHLVDPNDPRNAALMELLKAQEAQSVAAMGGVFRLDVPPGIALDKARIHKNRLKFLVRRWGSGTYRDSRCVLQAARQVPAPVALSDRDAEALEGIYEDSLKLFEMAPGGVGAPVARALLARQERALQMQSGPNLSHAINEREERIKVFAARVRAASVRLAGGKLIGRKFTTDDVVNDAPLPQMGKLDITSLNKLLEERRPLRRRRNPVKSVLTSVPRDTELLVLVERCSSLPMRIATETAEEERKDDQGPVDQNPKVPGRGLSCFVEVVYRTTALHVDADGKSHHEERVLRRQTASTDVDEFPVFNEQMNLPVFGVGDEPTPSAINETNNFITINVFDEFINTRLTDMRVKRDDGVSSPIVYPERERRFLGCVRIPLSAVYQMQVLEGVFKLEVPPVLLGYVQSSDRPPCVHLHLALRPQLAPPSIVDSEVARISGEAEEVARLASRWQLDALEVHAGCAGRVVKGMAVDADGTSVLVTRFVSPTPLPPNLSAMAANPQEMEAATGLAQISITEMVMIKIAQFVSQIPYLEDSGLSKRRSDIWCTNAEFLHLTAGDSEEHAHLLAGYFLEIGQQAFVVLGASTIGARSAFVLTTGRAAYDPNAPEAISAFERPLNGSRGQEGGVTGRIRGCLGSRGSPSSQTLPSKDTDWLKFDESQLRLWNPLTGACCSVKDPSGDLRQVGTVYDHTNVWANVQLTAQPWEMSWKLGDAKEWRPFFGLYLEQRELATLQIPPCYEELNEKFYRELEVQVEEAARDAIQKARGIAAYVTKPDNKISRLLKELLVQIPQALDRVAMASLSASLALAATATYEKSGNVIQVPSNPDAPPSRIGERHRIITEIQTRHNEEVKKHSRSDQINGHIIALPFSDRYGDAVAEAILNTGIHRIADDRVKYSLAAHVERGGASFACTCFLYVCATR